ncbi:MAG: prolipoprotein diacylglyceryl transferase [Leptospiraceae bacterium]|nr:prolipoprotein diacylglyceryl transferase [Leptospiraceae bacterium]
MFPVNIDWFFFQFRGYEGHWAVGVLLLGYFHQRCRSLKAGYKLEWYNTAWAVAILTAIVFARIFHFVFWDTKNFLQNPIILLTSTGGFAVLGATIGTAFGAWAYCKKTGVDFLAWCDCLMVPLTLGLAISRISCFLNGDAYGLPTASIFGVTFSEDSDAWMAEWRYLHQFYANQEDPLAVISQLFRNYVNLGDMPLPDSLNHLKALGIQNLAELTKYYPPTATGNYKAELVKLGLSPFPVIYPKVHPTQLYETGIMSFVLYLMYKIEKLDWSKRKLFFIFWIFYGLNRFIIEFFRGDRNLILGNLTYAQVITLIIVFFAVIGLTIQIFLARKISTES